MSAHQDGGSSSSARWLVRALIFLLVVSIVGAGGYGSTRYLGRLQKDNTAAMLAHPVARGELIVTVTEDGNLQSAANIDIKCQVAGGSSILWIVPDGKEVKQGEKLVELDAALLDDQINQQKITVEKARSTMVQAEKDYSVAQISVKEYLEGTYLKDLQTMEAQITISMENLRSSENSLAHSQRMFRKGYISSLELESQQFAVQRAKLELDSAKTARDVLEKFTKVKTLEDLESKVATAKAKLESERSAFALEEGKLKRLEAQRNLCTIHAPQDGMAVYANEQGGRFGSSQSLTIEEGAAVRERQTILRLPDLTHMEVKVNVHESKVESLARNMRARVRIQDREVQGTVTSIANQPEPTSFFSGNVKEYATLVRIDGQPDGLKPGMTAEVEILVAYLKDVLTLPIAAIVEQRGGYYCWVKVAGGPPEKRPLVLGVSNDQFVEVKDGVQEGEEVLLNPRAIVEDARANAVEVESVDVNKRFGESPPAAGKADEAGGRGPTDGAAGPGKAGPAGPGAGVPGPGGAGADRGGPGGGPGGSGPGGGAGPGGGGAPGGNRAGGGGRGGFDLMANDKDGDGKVSREEASSMPAQFFDNVDANQDGFIEKSEADAMRARRGAGGGGGAGGGMRNLMSNDKNQDGKVTRDEIPETMQGFFDRLDGNADGAIDQAEIDAARQRFQGGGGGGGFGGPQ
ncbi:MAG: HlyD family efflux transporter periplasmic adaptor subunit [Pirellulaceae bacterium]